MSDTLNQGCFAMPEPFFGSHQFRRKLVEVGSTKVLEFASLEQIPHAFLWIEFWSIARQSLQMNPFGCALCQKILDDPATMNAGPIPNDQQFPRDLAQKHLQKANHAWSFVRMIVHLHEQPPIHRQAPYRGKVITGQFDRQHGRLSDRRVGSYRHGQQIKGRLIYENDCAFFLFGLFFSSTQWWSRHTWIACSSRWVARVSGFCRLCLMAERRRPQWVG